jgi:hypothetical protein
LEDLLQTEVSDLAEMPEIGEAAASILEAARAEAARRSIQIGSDEGAVVPPPPSPSSPPSPVEH